MKIATILPIAHLHLEQNNDYHLCLAHLLGDDEYFNFFKAQASAGKFVMMDNGVVEVGKPLTIEELYDLAVEVGVNEFILPDAIRDRGATLALSGQAIGYCLKRMRSEGRWMNLVAVPQGATAEEWADCVREMLAWPVRTIGISRFTNAYFPNRLEALRAVPELIASSKDIHLLGCPGDPAEMADIDRSFPGRIRGVDSGIAAMYTQVGKAMCDGEPKPVVELDFAGVLPEFLLKLNIAWWQDRIQGCV